MYYRHASFPVTWLLTLDLTVHVLQTCLLPCYMPAYTRSNSPDKAVKHMSLWIMASPDVVENSSESIISLDGSFVRLPFTQQTPTNQLCANHANASSHMCLASRKSTKLLTPFCVTMEFDNNKIMNRAFNDVPIKRGSK